MILGLSVVAFGVATLSALLQARRLVEPLDMLADNADRLGRGESRLRPVSSGVPELDRVAAGLERSAESMAPRWRPSVSSPPTPATSCARR